MRQVSLSPTTIYVDASIPRRIYSSLGSRRLTNTPQAPADFSVPAISKGVPVRMTSTTDLAIRPICLFAGEGSISSVSRQDTFLSLLLEIPNPNYMSVVRRVASSTYVSTYQSVTNSCSSKAWTESSTPISISAARRQDKSASILKA